MLRSKVDGRITDELVRLTNGVDVLITPNSFRAVRGRTIAVAIFDEVAYWRSTESAVPDQEIYTAVEGGMLSIPTAMMIGISSPYKRSGLPYQKWAQHYGKNDDDVLVIRAPSRTLNPTLPQRIIDRRLAEDPEAGSAEYLAEWRDDISGFLDEALVQSCIDTGITIRPPKPEVDYSLALDQSGGRGDAAAAAVGHVEDGQIIIDCLYHRASPFQPSEMLAELGELAKRYRVTRVRIDKYGEPLITDGLDKVGLLSEVWEKNQSDVYLQSVQHFANGSVRLTDDRQLVFQLTSLQRRTAASGKSSVTHPVGQHDDLAAAVCSLVAMLGERARPTLIDARRASEDAVELDGRLNPIAVLGTLWIALDGRYGWVIVASCDPKLRVLVDPSVGELVVMDYGEGSWSWGVLDELAERMDDCAEEVGKLNTAWAQRYGVSAVVVCQDEVQSPTTMAMSRAFSSRVGRWDAERRRVGSDPIDGSWIADLTGTLLRVSTFVGSGRVRQTPAVKAKSGPSSIFRLLALKAGERAEDNPLTMAQLVSYAQLTSVAEAPGMAMPRGVARVGFV
jgi:hypothetical protein